MMYPAEHDLESRNQSNGLKKWTAGQGATATSVLKNVCHPVPHRLVKHCFLTNQSIESDIS